MDTLSAVVTNPQSYLLVVARLSGLFLFAPVFGSSVVPLLVRVALVLLLAWILFPIHAFGAGSVPLEAPALIVAMASELAIGLIVGFVANLVFVAFQVAGTIVGTQIGFGVLTLFDPLRHESFSSVIDQFYSTLGTLVFLVLNGHHMVVAALDRTYRAIPAGGVFQPEAMALPISRLTSEIFTAGFQLALPILAALLLTDLAFGLVARAVPQINVFFLGLPLKGLVGLVALSLALPASLAFMSDHIDRGMRDLLGIVRAL